MNRKKYARHLQLWRCYERLTSIWNSSLFFIAVKKKKPSVRVFSKWPLVEMYILSGKCEDVSVGSTAIILGIWNIFCQLKLCLYVPVHIRRVTSVRGSCCLILWHEVAVWWSTRKIFSPYTAFGWIVNSTLLLTYRWLPFGERTRRALVSERSFDKKCHWHCPGIEGRLWNL